MTITATTAAIAMVRVRNLSLKTYLLSEALAEVILEPFLAFGWPHFVTAYLLVRPFNFLSMRWVARPGIGAGLTALMLCWITYLTLPADISLYSATAIVQGGLYIALGMAAVEPEPILALFWIFMGLFNLGFSHGWQVPHYADLNEYWGMALASASFTAIALTQRASSQSLL